MDARGLSIAQQCMCARTPQFEDTQTLLKILLICGHC